MAGNRRSPLQLWQKLGASWGVSNGLRGVCGKGCLLLGHLCLPQCSRSGSGEAWWAFFETRPKGEEACQPSTVGEEAWREGGAILPASWTLADTISTNQLTGVPTRANSISWSLSHSRWATYNFIFATSLGFLRPWNEKNKLLLAKRR